MKLRNLITALTLLCAICFSSYAQDPGWTRVQTDNGEFSIEVPKDFSYVFDPEGFIVTRRARNFRLRDVNIVKGVVDHTFISFEVFRCNPDAVETLIDTGRYSSSKVTTSTLNGVQTQKVVDELDYLYHESHYFKSKEYIYLVTAVSRTKDAPSRQRFFDSLRFVPGSKDPAADVIRLSTVKVTPVDIRTQDLEPPPSSTTTTKAPPDPDSKSLVIASKPRASYTDDAVDNNVRGSVLLRVEFAANGFIPSIEVHKTLPAGLFRQVLFAALRLKFLPAEKAGLPVSKKAMVEYIFQ